MNELTKEFLINKLKKGTVKVINIKTGGLYHAERIVVNATNAQDGQMMVLYKNKSAAGIPSFVRELGEFCTKFKLAEDE